MQTSANALKARSAATNLTGILSYIVNMEVRTQAGVKEASSAYRTARDRNKKILRLLLGQLKSLRSVAHSQRYEVQHSKDFIVSGRVRRTKLRKLRRQQRKVLRTLSHTVSSVNNYWQSHIDDIRNQLNITTQALSLSGQILHILSPPARANISSVRTLLGAWSNSSSQTVNS